MIESAQAKGVDPAQPLDNVDDVVDVVDAVAEIATIFTLEVREPERESLRKALQKIREVTAGINAKVSLNDLIALRRRSLGGF
jgi:hypothetical protein